MGEKPIQSLQPRQWFDDPVVGRDHRFSVFWHHSETEAFHRIVVVGWKVVCEADLQRECGQAELVLGQVNGADPFLVRRGLFRSKVKAVSLGVTERWEDDLEKAERAQCIFLWSQDVGNENGCG